MIAAESPVPEFDQEMEITRRLLARVPADKGPWKPHAKSFSLGHLAQLVSRMPGWLTTVATTSRQDLTTFAGYSLETTETLLADFDQCVTEARAALAALSPSDLRATWSLRRGEQLLFSAPRAAVLRSHLNHLVHHRGQLSVYLRLLDVPLPSIYGPTADERM